MKDWDKLRFFFFSFVLLLALSAISVLTIFVNLQEGESIFLLRNSSKTHWSESSDFLGAIFGIPTALAGSIVAILLAHKAYAVSKQQSKFEAQIYLEAAATQLAETYWDVSSAMRKVDEAHDALLIDLTRKTETKAGSAEGLNRDHLDKEYKEALNSLAHALLSIHKNALAFETWKSIDHAKIADNIRISQNSALSSFTSGARRPSFTLCDTTDLAALSQSLIINSREMSLPFGLVKGFYILLWQKIDLFNRNLCPDGRYRNAKEVEENSEGVLIQDDIFELQPEPSIFKLRHLAEFKGSRTAFMGERLSASYGPSKFGDQEDGIPSTLVLRDGAFILAAIFQAWPTDENLETAVRKFMNDRKIYSIDLDVAARIVRDKNIPAYIPNSMRDDAAAFLEDADFAVGPSPSPYLGY